MSQQEFESYLRLLARFLHLSGGQRETIARELRAHMEDRLEDLLARGCTREEAIETALDEFGDAAALAGEFGRIGRRRRWIMRTTTATIGIAAAVLLVSFLLPEHRGWLPAPTPTQASQSDDTAPAERPPALAANSALPREYVSELEPEANRRTLERLQQTMSIVDLADGTSLADAVEFLRVQTKISITVNWAALALVGIERTTDTGGLNLRDVKAETVLDILLNNVTQAGGGAGRLAYDITDGVLRISRVEELSAHVLVRVYDCRDLLDRTLTSAQREALGIFSARLARGPHPSTRPANTAETQPTTGKHGLPARSAGRDAANVDPLVAELLGELRDRADELTDVVTSMVEPGSWEPEATIGCVSEYDGFLVVRHTWSAHRQIAELLSTIRKAKAERGTANAVPAARPE